MQKLGLGHEKLTIAGIANCFSRAYSKRRRTSSPTMTPDLRDRTSVTPMIAVVAVVVDLVFEAGELFYTTREETESDTKVLWQEFNCDKKSKAAS